MRSAPPRAARFEATMSSTVGIEVDAHPEIEMTANVRASSFMSPPAHRPHRRPETQDNRITEHRKTRMLSRILLGLARVLFGFTLLPFVLARADVGSERGAVGLVPRVPFCADGIAFTRLHPLPFELD